MKTTNSFDDLVITTLLAGGVAVVRTDTLYGIVALARNQTAVRRVYEIKGREATKSPIVLIDSLEQLFDSYDEATISQVHQYWPGPNSIVLPSSNAPTWIRRDNASVAYRLPAHEALRVLIRQTGPLIAPSANPEGLLPPTTIAQAQDYFGDAVDIYVDGGEVLNASASSIYRLQNGNFEKLR